MIKQKTDSDARTDNAKKKAATPTKLGIRTGIKAGPLYQGG